jgi:phenylalanyl-tRNA synthetase alpha chain
MDVDKVIKELSHHEKKVLLTLKNLGGRGTPEAIFDNGVFQESVEVMNAASWLKSKHLVTIEEHIATVYSLGKEGELFTEKGFPERRALNFLAEHHGTASLQDLRKALEEQEIPVAIGWLKRKGWATIRKEGNATIIEMTPEGTKAVKENDEDYDLLLQLRNHPEQTIEKQRIQLLLTRKQVLREKEIISSTIILTDAGRQVLEKGFDIKEEISQITPSLIKSEEWTHKVIRPYDIHAFAPSIYGGKPHPMVSLISTIRQIFLAMGFEEIQGNYVESCFWNMDMLFIPQDHPAREMQDTLYCRVPSEIPIDDKDLVERIARVHENGGETSSTGWGYSFSKKEGNRALLRTHTTVNTIRYLYHHPQPPCKVFSLGRVFRKENIDATHLPEFYQIEGIVHEEQTNFRELIGVLKEFYKRMGFEKIRFRPGYFPYTEPSMEVDVLWNNKWMELGGSGIFRPEVTEPLGITSPVLAWGLGLERLAMMRFGVTDIRNLYVSDFDWLRKEPIP